ncbi:MAG: prephenate dehydratase [Oligoflexus sp.]
MKVGFQGVSGAYSEQAALQYFRGQKIQLQPMSDFESVFRAVEARKLQYAVLPIENSLAGSIHENYDHLRQKPVWIIGEHKLHIDHCLLAKPGSKLEAIREVYSHPQALSQCMAFIRKIKAQPMPYFDTAGSARFLAESGEKHMAAIASSQAAKDYGLRVIAKSIQDEETNYTRFVVIKRRPKAYPAIDWKGASKTSIVFSLRNAPGGLHKALSVFAIRDIDLTKIESRPLRGSPWKYLFYLDIEGHVSDPAVARALGHLEEVTHHLQVLGSYQAVE